jgi:O-phosphoseryl-tRNA(Sec) kinase
MKSKKKICLMGLIGLPGAGKTSFCRAYAHHLAQQKPDIRMVTVALDDLIPQEEQAAAAGQPGTFKRWREQVAAAVEFHIDRIAVETESGTAEKEVETKSEKTSANLCDIATRPKESEIPSDVAIDSENHLDTSSTGTTGGTGTGTTLNNDFVEKLNFSSTAHDRILIVIDDNSYLRSMRYPYYQMARRHSCGFCQLHLAADVSTAIKRNAAREAGLRVEESVIRTMAEKLEPPDPLSNPWEMFSFSIPVTEGADLNLGRSNKRCGSGMFHPGSGNFFILDPGFYVLSKKKKKGGGPQKKTDLFLAANGFCSKF